MNGKMRRFGMVAVTLGGLGVIILGTMLWQAMDDPKARTGGLGPGFLLFACIAGIGVFVLSMVRGPSKPSREGE
jgi:hypothetical protein